MAAPGEPCAGPGVSAHPAPLSFPGPGLAPDLSGFGTGKGNTAPTRNPRQILGPRKRRDLSSYNPGDSGSRPKPRTISGISRSPSDWGLRALLA